MIAIALAALLAAADPSEATPPPLVSKADYVQLAVCLGHAEGMHDSVLKVAKGAPSDVRTMTDPLQTKVDAQLDRIRKLVKAIQKAGAKAHHDYPDARAEVNRRMNEFAVNRVKQGPETIAAYIDDKQAEFDKYCAPLVDMLALGRIRNG